MSALKINRYENGGARIFFEREDGTRDLVVDIYDDEPGSRREAIIKTLLDSGVLNTANVRRSSNARNDLKGDV